VGHEILLLVDKYCNVNNCPMEGSSDLGEATPRYGSTIDNYQDKNNESYPLSLLSHRATSELSWWWCWLSVIGRRSRDGRGDSVGRTKMLVESNCSIWMVESNTILLVSQK